MTFQAQSSTFSSGISVTCWKQVVSMLTYWLIVSGCLEPLLTLLLKFHYCVLPFAMNGVFIGQFSGNFGVLVCLKE